MDYSKYGFKQHTGILPGWSWLETHEHDLDGWQPTFELSTGHSHYTMHVKNAKTLSEVIKIHK